MLNLIFLENMCDLQTLPEEWSGTFRDCLGKVAITCGSLIILIRLPSGGRATFVHLWKQALGWVGLGVTVAYVHMTVLKAAYWVITSPAVLTGLASGHTCIQ